MTRFAYSTICDDVRQEVNGKMSYMGVYQGNMLCQEFPLQLPKLCIGITVVTPIERPFESLNFKGSFDGELLFEMSLAKDQIDTALEATVAFRPADAKFRTIQVMMVMSPIAFSKAGEFKIEVDGDGEAIRCNGLSVQQAPDGMTLVV
ncbi:hypothetical protein D3C84_571360 [compost metagenome]